jgi:ubiquinone/menaquinone biosynthesis C-methylase UbiE
MLEQARLEASRAGLDNIEFVRGTAVDLPYPDGTVPMVSSRLAIHHFEAPAYR